MALVWLIAIIVTVVVEALVAGLVSIWFIPGEIIAMLLALCNAGIGWQIGVFLFISIITVPLGIKFSRLMFKGSKTNIDAIIGQTAIITEEVSNLESRGAARLEGKIWSARSESDKIILAVGEHVEVVDIRGVKLICKRK